MCVCVCVCVRACVRACVCVCLLNHNVAFLKVNITTNHILGFFRKMNIFWEYEDLVDIFGGHHEIGLV